MRANQSGFTAVELLITLFVAAVFLIAGYQLFIQVTRDGSDAQRTARLSSRTYDKLRLYTGVVLDRSRDGCKLGTYSASSPSSGSEVSSSSSEASLSSTSSGGSVISYTGSVACPYSTASKPADTFQITVVGKYIENGQERVITHSTYANK